MIGVNHERPGPELGILVHRMAHNSPVGGELEASMKKSGFTEEQNIGLQRPLKQK
jgi:hypothetical protein